MFAPDYISSRCSAVQRQNGSTNRRTSGPDILPARPGSCRTRDHADITGESSELYKGEAEGAGMADDE